MDPEQAEALINAAADGQLADADRAALADHMAGSPDAKELDAVVRRQDALLRAAFVPRRAAAADIAERVMNSLVPPLPARPRSVFRTWLPLLLAAAAGFLLAVVLFRPWEKGPAVANDGPRIVVEPAVAHLGVATGPVKIMPRDQLDFMVCPSSGPIAAGAKVSTGPEVRCELSTADGSAVRMNGDTVLRFDQPRSVSMEQGQLWSNVARSTEPFAVNSAGTTIVSDEGKFELSCTAGETTLRVMAGSARLHGKDGDRTIAAGREVTIVQGAIADDRPIDDLILSTRWIDGVLALKGPQNAELDERVNQLLAQIGRAKLTYLYEDEIRSLGDASAEPLTHCLQCPPRQIERAKRVEAARILADLAPPRSIPDLIALLSDDDGEVRFYVAQGLSRLTGQTQAHSPDQWRTDTPISRDAARRDWQNWWEQNKSYYTGANPADDKARDSGAGK